MGENKEKVGEVMISIIQKPAGFKIRRKGDVETFKNVAICEQTVTIKSTMKDADVEAIEKLAEEILG